MTNLSLIGNVLGFEYSLCFEYCNIVFLSVNLIVPSRIMGRPKYVTCHLTSCPIFLAILSVPFQAEVYAILACVHEIETQDRPEKYISIFPDSQAALKALQAAKTTSPLVQQCQQALNDISAQNAVGLYWVPGHARVR